MGTFLQKIKQLVIMPSRRFVAVDFDSASVRMVAAEATADGTRIDLLAEAPLPEGANLDDPAAVGAVLARALRDHHLHSLPVLMDVPRGKAVLKPLTLPGGIPAQDLASAVHFQMDKELPFGPEEAVVDFALARHGAGGGPEAGGLSVLVAAVPVPVVDYYGKVAEAAGVRLLRLGLRPYANLQSLLAAGLGGGPHAVALVHLTGHEAEIDIAEGGELVFTRSAVVKLRPPHGGLSDAGVAETVDVVVREVSRTLQSYQPLEGHGRVSSACIAGGTGLESRVARELSRALNVPCPMFHPGPSIRLPRGPAVPGAFPAALGLAVGHGAGTLPLDFLNPKRPPARRNVRRARLTAAGVAAAVACVLLGGIGALYVGAAGSEVRRLREELRTLEERNKVVLEVKARQEAIGDWLGLGFNWLEHWANIARLAPPADKLYVDSLAFDNRGSITRADGRRTPAGRILFTAHAGSPQAIEHLLQALQQAGYRCKTSSGSAEKAEGGYPHSAAMEVVIDPGGRLKPPPGSAAARPAGDCSAEQFAEGGR